MRQKGSLLLLELVLLAFVTTFFAWQNLGDQVHNVSAVESGVGIGVYCDAAATNSCQSISWGKLTPGSSTTTELYVKNLGVESLFYLLTTDRWVPSEASQYLILKWDYDGSRASPGSILRVAVTLLVSSYIRGIVDFSFDVTILGSSSLWGDINGDGRVDVKDIAIVAVAYGSYPDMPTWNLEADLNGDGRVDIKDIMIASKNFGKTF